MARITVDLVRKRAEHNNCEISTLEELSLHQQDLVKIEHLDRWCKSLKILYFQNNLISRIENVSRLKQLQYLNLALNNIETVENLQNCEFLEKLDLTLNFIGDLFSVESLSSNIHLRELFLTGNPCTDYEGYRDFVIAVLPQITSLDGTEVTRSERILATQKLPSICKNIIKCQETHREKRAKEKEDHEDRQARRKEKKPGFDGRWYTDPNAHCDKSEGGGAAESRNGEDDDDDEFWKEDTPYTPESRTETQLHISEKKKEKAPESKGPDQVKRVRKLEMDGKMLNVNEGRYDFHLTESDDGCYVLDIDIPRFMSTSLLDCDVQTTYVRVTIKGKVLQLVLQEEVSPDRSSAQRSQTTGHMVITMPKVNHTIRAKQTKSSHPNNGTSAAKVDINERNKIQLPGGSSKLPEVESDLALKKGSTELLEVDPTVKKCADYANIVLDKETQQRPPARNRPNPPDPPTCRNVNEDFIDDPDVPPLI